MLFGNPDVVLAEDAVVVMGLKPVADGSRTSSSAFNRCKSFSAFSEAAERISALASGSMRNLEEELELR